jgi:CelD/BcsL family acetyltransferase involved in cellulose biosynthesis
VGAGVELKIYRSFEELPFLGERWNDLLAASETNTVFQTYEWHQAWWSVFGPERRLWIVVGLEDGDLVGIAPLAINVSGGIRELRFAADARADYCDFIAGDHKRAFLLGLVELLHRHRDQWDALHLQNIPEDSSTAGVLREICPALGLRDLTWSRADCPAISLPQGAESAAFVRRKSLVRPYNYFRQLGRLEFRELTAESLTPDVLTGFFEQHIQRWAATPSPSLFLEQKNEDFYRQLTRHLSPTGWLSFAVVSLDDEPIAFHYGFTYGSSFTWYKPSFNVAYAEHSPGTLLLRFLLERAVELNKTCFDFTIGNEPFKSRYSTVVRHNITLRVYHAGWRYEIARMGRWARSHAKRGLTTARSLRDRIRQDTAATNGDSPGERNRAGTSFGRKEARSALPSTRM